MKKARALAFGLSSRFPLLPFFFNSGAALGFFGVLSSASFGVSI